MTRFQDAAHFVRLILLLAAGVAGFFVFRAYAIPASFGQYGHYRGNALNDLRAAQVGFAGRAACESCHDDQVKKIASGVHAKIHCEACHGPQLKHATDIEPKPVLPKTPELCVPCHEAGTGKPSKTVHTVNIADHSNGMDCKSCHQPHSPKEGL